MFPSAASLFPDKNGSQASPIKHFGFKALPKVYACILHSQTTVLPHTNFRHYLLPASTPKPVISTRPSVHALLNRVLSRRRAVVSDLTSNIQHQKLTKLFLKSRTFVSVGTHKAFGCFLLFSFSLNENLWSQPGLGSHLSLCYSSLALGRCALIMLH